MKELRSAGVDVHLFDPWNPQLETFDLVHYFSCVGGSSHFCNFIKSLGIPLVVSASLWIEEHTKHLYPTQEITTQLQLADLVIANSNMECDAISNVLKIERRKLRTVYNGVDRIFFEKIDQNIFRKKYKIKENFILNVGNIEPRKNQLNLIKAIKNYTNDKLVIIGGIRDSQYAQEVFKVGGDQIIYIDYMQHENTLLRSAYAACDVFCLPSTLETPGLAALEASCILDKLAITGRGSTSEYFGKNVCYLDPESIDSIGEAIVESKKRETKLNNEECKIFGWDFVVKDLIRVYVELIPT
jgi:glycosyltransferase involved in cell wall biosynthesis